MTQAPMGGHGYMGGYGVWPVLGILLAIVLVVALFRMARSRR